MTADSSQRSSGSEDNSSREAQPNYACQGSYFMQRLKAGFARLQEQISDIDYYEPKILKHL